MFQFTNLQNTLLDLLAFLLTATMAFTFEWQPNELCWGLWVSSLLTGWAVILSAVLRTILHLAGIPLLREEDLEEKGDPLSAYFRSRSFRSKTKDAKNFLNNLPRLWVAVMWLGAFVFESPVTLPQLGLTWVSLLFLGILGSGLAFVMAFYLIHEIGPTRTSMVTYLFPLGGVILGVTILHEQLTWQVIMGAILILVSLVIANRGSDQALSETAPAVSD